MCGVVALLSERNGMRKYIYNPESDVYVKYCRYAEVIRMMEKNGKKKEPFKAQFFGALEVVIWAVMCIVMYILLRAICGIFADINVTGLAGFVAISILCILVLTICGGAIFSIGAILMGYIDELREECLDKARYGHYLRSQLRQRKKMVNKP